ncbi:uncharacterized protein LOC108244630 isoform X1 [Kryptolebias marmoratus]|uniref:uncharacterized protein LOC108244630 isoform X1 n=1 Tax=Kryptolebias marmoratus TaxID=37003 RepID=UPI0007F8728E|nr:uncharacterized protein LOC108244630 isoform X1 [Kryptolebias marmoratus]
MTHPGVLMTTPALSGTSMTNSTNSSVFCKFNEDFKYILLPVSYALVFVIGLALNATALYVIVFRTKRWRPSTVYMFNLTMCDTLYVFTLPFLVYYYADENDWPFSEPVCKLIRFLFYANLLHSVPELHQSASLSWRLLPGPLPELGQRSSGPAGVCGGVGLRSVLPGSCPLLRENQGRGHRADLLRHHQPGAFRRLPGVQLRRVGAHVRLALHGGDGVLRPHGAEAPGARVGLRQGSRGRKGRPDSPAVQAEVGEDDHRCAGSVHAVLPPFPPHQEPLLLLQVPEAGRSIADQLQVAGGVQRGLQGDSAFSQRQQLRGPHPLLPGRAGRPQQPHQEDQTALAEARQREPTATNATLMPSPPQAPTCHGRHLLSASCWRFSARQTPVRASPRLRATV